MNKVKIHDKYLCVIHEDKEYILDLDDLIRDHLNNLFELIKIIRDHTDKLLVSLGIDPKKLREAHPDKYVEILLMLSDIELRQITLMLKGVKHGSNELF